MRWPKIRLSTSPVNHTQIMIPGKQFNSFSRHCTQSEKPFISKWWNDVINMCPVYSHTVKPVQPPNTNPFPWLTKTQICKLAYFGGPSVRVQVRAAFFSKHTGMFLAQKNQAAVNFVTLSMQVCTLSPRRRLFNEGNVPLHAQNVALILSGIFRLSPPFTFSLMLLFFCVCVCFLKCQQFIENVQEKNANV